MILKGYDKNSKQCREKWNNYINPSLNKAPLTNREIDTLFKLHQKYGTAWSKMTSLIENRSSNKLKNTFHREVKKIVKLMKRRVKNITNQSIFNLEFTVNLSMLSKVGKFKGIPINQIPNLVTLEFTQILKTFNNKKSRSQQVVDSWIAQGMPTILQSSDDNCNSKVTIRSKSNEINEISNQLLRDKQNFSNKSRVINEIDENANLKYEEKMKIVKSSNNIVEDLYFEDNEYDSCDLPLWNEVERIESSPTFRAIFEYNNRIYDFSKSEH